MVCIGRCDARCYGAKRLECTCVCGGKNHAVGKKMAIAHTALNAERWFREFATPAGEKPQRFELGVPVEQMRLFMEDISA